MAETQMKQDPVTKLWYSEEVPETPAPEVPPVKKSTEPSKPTVKKT